jgi:hypothetical protein
MRFHTRLTPERWFKFSMLEQLANVGSEIERTISWKKQGNLEYSQKAFEAALELLDLTIADPKNCHGKRKELLRAREFLIDYFMFDNAWNTSEQFWQQYFL